MLHHNISYLTIQFWGLIIQWMSYFVDQGQKYNQKREQFESSKMDLNINLIFSDNLYPFFIRLRGCRRSIPEQTIPNQTWLTDWLSLSVTYTWLPHFVTYLLLM